MIIGIGLDMIELDRIAEAYAKRQTFAKRVLTAQEYALFETLKGMRQIEFLAGRFAAKEAFAKAYGTGIGEVSFQDIEILPNHRQKPVLSAKQFKGICHVSITHTKQMAAAQVILEEIE